MPNQQDLRTLVDRFVTDLSVLVHQEALATVRAALGGTPAPVKRGPGRPKKAAKRGPGRPRKKTARKAKPGRRAPEDVAALGETVLAHVRANPGQRLEEIGRELRMPTAVLKRPIANLMEAGSLRTEGQKRGTMYFAGKGGKRKAGKAKAKRATKAKAKRVTRKKAGRKATKKTKSKRADRKAPAKKARRKLSPEQKAALLERLAKGRAAKRAAG